MKNINFNSKIKSLLGKHSTPSDHDAIWKNVQVALKNEKRKKRFVLFFIIPLAVVSLFSTFYLFQSEKLSTTEIVSENQEIADNYPSFANANSPKKQSNNKTYQNSLSSSSNENSSTSSKKPNGTKSVNTPIISEVKITNSESGVYNKVNSKNLSNTVVNQYESTAQKADFVDRNKGLSTQKVGDILQKNDLALMTISSLKSEIDYTNTYNLSLPVLKDKIDLVKQIMTPWKIGFYFAPGLFSRNMTALNGDDETISLASKRSQFETAVEELSIGTEVAFNLNKNWSISAGLEYSKLVEKFEANYSDTVTALQDNVLIGIVLRSTNSNQFERIYGETPVTNIRSVYQKTYNRYHLLSLPILLNYQINFNRINLGVHGGINIQSLFSVSGTALDKNGLIALSDQRLKGQKVYTSSFHFNPIAGLDLSLQASNNLSFYMAPEAILSLNGLTDRSSGLKHSIDRYRLRIGARFKM